MHFIKKSAALSALVFAFVCPAFAGSKCVTDTSTELVFITPETSQELTGEGQNELLSFLEMLATTQATDFSFSVVTGRTGRLVSSCGLGIKPHSVKWRNEYVIAPAFNNIGHFVRNALEGEPLNFVAALETASTQIHDDKETVIIIDAPMLFSDEREPSLSFNRGVYPSDGVYFQAPTENLFSVMGRENLLAGAKVYFVTGDEDYANTIHERALMRFLANYIALQGGELYGIGKDASGVIETALQGRKTLRQTFAEPDREAKPELLWAKPTKLSLYEQASEGEVKAYSCNGRAVPKRPTDVRIALRWNTINTDLDVHVSAGGPELSYQNTVTTNGTFQKMSEGSEIAGLHGFELVTLSNALPENIVIWVNAYEVRGNASGAITGTLRITFGDEESCLSIPVKLNVHNGNRGASSRARQSSPYWVSFKLADLIG